MEGATTIGFMTPSAGPRPRVQDESLHRLGKAFIVVGVGDQIGLRLHLRAGIAHRDAETAFAKHQHVVRHVADRGDLVGRNREEL